MENKISIPKAIEDLQARIDGEFNIKGEDLCEDMKLGIEALKRIDHCHRWNSGTWVSLLPGETKD